MAAKKTKKVVENTQPNIINVNVESMKGTQVSINGDMNKIITIYENDVNFIRAVEDFRGEVLRLNSLSEEYAKVKESDNVEEKEISELLDRYENMTLEIKSNFVKIFRVQGTFERIFGDVLDPYQILEVIVNILDVCYTTRQNQFNKYTRDYK